MFAWLTNSKPSGLVPKTKDRAQILFFRKRHYLWFVLPLAAVLFVDNGAVYTAFSPHSLLLMFGAVSASFGVSRMFKDWLESQDGPSNARERGARIYASLVAGGVALFLFFMEFS